MTTTGVEGKKVEGVTQRAFQRRDSKTTEGVATRADSERNTEQLGTLISP
jgi:hypothetical protein